jgi:hypothetical protein
MSLVGKEHGGPKSPEGPDAAYLDWAIDTKFRYLREGDWLPLLVRFKPPAAEDEEAGSLERFIRLDWLNKSFENDVVIPDLIRRAIKRTPSLRQSKQFDFCVLWVRRVRMTDLALDASWKRTILSADLGPPINLADGLGRSGIHLNVAQPPEGVRSKSR